MTKSCWWLVVLFVLSACAAPALDPSLTLITPAHLATTVSATATPAPSSTRTPGVFFDDFTYTQQQSMIDNGWIIRTAPGWPGVPNAVWAKNSVSFIDDADQSGSRLVRMTSSTNGTAARQTQFCHQRKYLEGTFAARVRFTDRPAVTDDLFTHALLVAEAQRAWELHQAGLIRELYFRADWHEAVLMLECADVDEARSVLDTLPLVRAKLIGFELIPLMAYPGFARLFTADESKSI